MLATFRLFILLFFAIGLVKPTLFAQSKGDSLRIRFRNYTIKKFPKAVNGDYYAKVFDEDREVYQVSAEKPSHIQFVAINNKATYDINQDSVYNFIFQVYTSDDPSYFTWYILHLGRQDFKVLDEIKSDYTTPWLSDFDKDGIYEIVLDDYTFRNWNASLRESPVVSVVLKLGEEGYRLAPEVMQAKELHVNPDDADIVREVMQEFYDKSSTTYPNTVKIVGGNPDERWGFIPSRLWINMFRLVYMGKAREAYDFLGRAWYEGIEGKEVFWQDFLHQFQKSPYWSEIEAMNEWPVSKPGGQE
ncbi:MAG: hypothetical protein AAFU64_02455 [Bacteroidota bacterium]